MEKFCRHAIGWFFIFWGFIGLFLPILQGILFLFIGAIILAPVIPFFQRNLEKIKARYPCIFDKAHSFIERRLFKNLPAKGTLFFKKGE